MTSWEVLALAPAPGSSRKTGGAHRRLRRKAIAFGIAFSLLFPVLQAGGVWAGTNMALGVFSQGLGLEDLDQNVKPEMHYVLTYTKGAGVSFQTLEDTLIRVHVDGATAITQAQLPHVQQILNDAGIMLGEKDRAQARIAVGGQSGESMPEIDVTRVRSKTVCETEPIPYTEVRVEDAYLPPGQTEVRSPGQQGILLKKYDVTTENDKEVARRQTGSEVLKQPAPKTVAYGIKTDAAERKASRAGGSRVARSLKVVATAYTHTGDKTYSGIWPYVGGVAVDPKVIPIGAKLYIEGYGPAKAVDTGGLIKGNKIDLFYDTEAECVSWGKRTVTVSILE